jgi:hypothetical protein
MPVKGGTRWRWKGGRGGAHSLHANTLSGGVGGGEGGLASPGVRGALYHLTNRFAMTNRFQARNRPGGGQASPCDPRPPVVGMRSPTPPPAGLGMRRGGWAGRPRLASARVAAEAEAGLGQRVPHPQPLHRVQRLRRDAAAAAAAAAGSAAGSAAAAAASRRRVPSSAAAASRACRASSRAAASAHRPPRPSSCRDPPPPRPARSASRNVVGFRRTRERGGRGGGVFH